MTTYTVEIQYPTEMACEGPETYTDEVAADSVDGAVLEAYRHMMESNDLLTDDSVLDALSDDADVQYSDVDGSAVNMDELRQAAADEFRSSAKLNHVWAGVVTYPPEVTHNVTLNVRNY